jgi:glutamyl-Q tRNA(Asp) synthetase
MANVVTRFAPSPTGYLHLGHAHAALFAQAQARAANGTLILRIEDIDRTRCRPEFETAILDDLTWLGIAWTGPVRRQSDHFDEYRAALSKLEAMGLIYPCFCTRADIASAGNAPHDLSMVGPATLGPDGPIYPGTSRALAPEARAKRIAGGNAYALRLDMEQAIARTGSLTWRDLDAGIVTATPEAFGDVVLARKDTPTSYHLSVTHDDHLQGITLVTRGEDLRAATHIHRLLQALLGYATPDYRFHALLTDATGRRLAKRDHAETLKALRDSGKTPGEVRALAGF